MKVRHKEPCIGSQKVGVEWCWVEWGCYYGRRNLGDFSNQGCRCLSRDYFVGVDYSFTSH